MKYIVRLFLAAVLPVVWAVPAMASSGTSARLTINPEVCIVDVVQDGSNQVLQASSPDCDVALPILLSSPTGLKATAGKPLFAPQFIADKTNTQLELRPQVEGVLTPIAFKEHQSFTEFGPTQLARTITGIGLTLLAIVIGLDIALFELGYSRSFARWTRKHMTSRILKK